VNVGNLAGRLECIQILSSDSTEIIKQLRKETKDVNTKSGYEELMRIRDDGERVNIYFKEKKNKKNEFVLIADESDEYTIISIVGELTLQEMQEMVSGL
jgi:UDP-N-acetyl-D-mannosaminuronate dehydrogenase